MQADSFFRGCRHSDHHNKSNPAFKVTPYAFFTNEKVLSDNGTFDTSIYWHDDDHALSFFYNNDKKNSSGENTKHGITEIDFPSACQNIIDADFQNIVSLNHYPDPSDPDNTYHGNISFVSNFREILDEKFPGMPKKEKLRQFCNCFAYAEKNFYTPHDLQNMFPEK